MLIQQASISFEEYDEFVRQYSEEYLTPIDVQTPLTFTMKCTTYFFYEDMSSMGIVLSNSITGGTGTWGCFPWMVESAFDNYIDEGNYDDLSIEKYDTINLGQNRIEGLIAASLEKDIPVIFMTNYFSKVTCQCKNKSGRSYLGTHYITITGIEINEITGDTMLFFSTWSDIATAKLNDFYFDEWGGSTVFILKEEV